MKYVWHPDGSLEFDTYAVQEHNGSKVLKVKPVLFGPEDVARLRRILNDPPLPEKTAGRPAEHHEGRA